MEGILRLMGADGAADGGGEIGVYWVMEVWLWGWEMICSGGGGLMLYACMPITGFVCGSLITETEDERLEAELQGNFQMKAPPCLQKWDNSSTSERNRITAAILRA